jgi:hypothetical protein
MALEFPHEDMVHAGLHITSCMCPITCSQRLAFHPLSIIAVFCSTVGRKLACHKHLNKWLIPPAFASSACRITSFLALHGCREQAHGLLQQQERLKKRAYAYGLCVRVVHRLTNRVVGSRCAVPPCKGMQLRLNRA